MNPVVEQIIGKLIIDPTFRQMFELDPKAALARYRPEQVISTTVHPLFPLLASGLFDEALYYRLNVVFLSIDATGSSL
jgi:transcriptional regulator of aromatic amino acid metabolism